MSKKHNTPNFCVDGSFKTSIVSKSVQGFSTYDNKQQNKMTPPTGQASVLYHSQLIDKNNQYNNPIDDLQRQIKIKDLAYEQIAGAFYQQKKEIEELKQALQICQQEKSIVQQQYQQMIENSDLRKSGFSQCQQLNTLFQKENAELKLVTSQLKEQLQSVSTENKLLKEQVESMTMGTQRKDSSKVSLDNLLYDIEQHQPTQEGSANTSITFDKKQYNSKKIPQLQVEVQRYQIQLTEKDKLIKQLTDQNIILQQTQQKLSRCQKKVNFLGTPEIYQGKSNPILIQEENNENNSMGNCVQDYLSERKQTKLDDSQFPLKTSSSARSVLCNKSKQEVKQMYEKINQSALFTASIYSTMLDYNNLHQCLSPNKKNPTQIKQL